MSEPRTLKYGRCLICGKPGTKRRPVGTVVHPGLGMQSDSHQTCGWYSLMAAQKRVRDA